MLARLKLIEQLSETVRNRLFLIGVEELSETLAKPKIARPAWFRLGWPSLREFRDIVHIRTKKTFLIKELPRFVSALTCCATEPARA